VTGFSGAAHHDDRPDRRCNAEKNDIDGQQMTTILLILAIGALARMFELMLEFRRKRFSSSNRTNVQISPHTPGMAWIKGNLL